MDVRTSGIGAPGGIGGEIIKNVSDVRIFPEDNLINILNENQCEQKSCSYVVYVLAHIYELEDSTTLFS